MNKKSEKKEQEAKRILNERTKQVIKIYEKNQRIEAKNRIKY